MSASIEVLDGGLDAAKPWWDELVASSQFPSPFASHVWLSTWWEVYGSEEPPFVLRLRKGNTTIAAGAFYRLRRRIKGMLPVTELRLVGDRFVGSEGLDFIARRGLENEAASAIQRYLREGGARSDVLHFDGLRPGAVLLREGIVPNSAGSRTESVHRCPYFQLDSDRIRPISKSFGSRVARKSRGLIDRGGHRFARCDSPASIERALDGLFGMHQARWVEKGKDGSFHTREKRVFYRAVAPRMLVDGSLELFVIEDGGQPKAVLFGASIGSRLFYLQSGFDEDISSFGPGNILIYQILLNAQERGFAVFDFMKGADSYKYLWTDRESHLHRRKEYLATWKGRLACAAAGVEQEISSHRRRSETNVLTEAR